MKVVPLAAAAVFLLCFSVRAESSCAALTRLTDSVERTLKALEPSAKVPKALLHEVTRDLEVATSVSRDCSDQKAKLHLAAVKAMLSDVLLAISDSATTKH
jgi:hypothetical protein